VSPARQTQTNISFAILMLPPSFSGILIPEGLTVYIELPFLEQLKRGKKDY
jgi:hypothetical protein